MAAQNKLFQRLIWLADTVYSAKRITMDEIDSRWSKSPFISPAEKAVYHACYKEKRYMIHLVNRSLDGKFVYPTGADFKACTEGFLLVLAPYGDDHIETHEARISRAQCLSLNDFAADLSTNSKKDEEIEEIEG